MLRAAMTGSRADAPGLGSRSSGGRWRGGSRASAQPQPAGPAGRGRYQKEGKGHASGVTLGQSPRMLRAPRIEARGGGARTGKAGRGGARALPPAGLAGTRAVLPSRREREAEGVLAQLRARPHPTPHVPPRARAHRLRRDRWRGSHCALGSVRSKSGQRDLRAGEERDYMSLLRAGGGRRFPEENLGNCPPQNCQLPFPRAPGNK